MNQIAMRVGYLYSLRNNKMKKVLEKYDLGQYEYLLMEELKYKDDIDIDFLVEKIDFDKQIIQDLLKGLEQKNYISIENNNIKITDKYNKIRMSLKRDIKKIDQDFTKNIDHREYEQLIDVLDKLIYYYEE